MASLRALGALGLPGISLTASPNLFAGSNSCESRNINTGVCHGQKQQEQEKRAK